MSVLLRALWSDDTTEMNRLDEVRAACARWVHGSGETRLVDGDVEFERTVRDKDRGTERTLHRKVTVHSSTSTEQAGLRLLLRDAPGADQPDQTVWTVEVRAVETDQKLHVMVETGMETDDPATRIQIGRPRVIDDLLALCPNPTLGSSPVSKDVVDLGAEDIPALVALLREPTRALPLIVFSEPTGSDDPRWRDLARMTATRSRGFATVVRLDGQAVTALREALGRLGIWGGGVRTYAPAPLDSAADAWRHVYIPGQRVRDMDLRVVDRLVAESAALSARRRLPEPLVRLLDDLAPSETGTDADDTHWILRAQWDEEIAPERDERAQLEHQHNELLGRFARLQERLREHDLEGLFWETYSPGEDDIPDESATISDAVLNAQIYLSDWIRIHDNAARDLDKIDTAVTARAWGNTAWRGFRALAEFVKARRGGFAGDFKAWCEKSGHPLAWPATSKKLAMRESDSVMNSDSLSRHRVLPVDTAVSKDGWTTMQAHLKVSEGGGDLAPRIYFYDATDGPIPEESENDKRLIHVGFIGPHYLMPNTKS